MERSRSGLPWDSMKEEKLQLRLDVCYFMQLMFVCLTYAMQSAPSCSGSPTSSTQSPAEYCAM